MEFIKNSLSAKCPHSNNNSHSISLPTIHTNKNLSITSVKGRNDDLSKSEIRIELGLFKEERARPTILKSILELNDNSISTNQGRNKSKHKEE
jgi:hypothetical protein